MRIWVLIGTYEAEEPVLGPRFGHSGMLLHCVWSVEGASPNLDTLALAYFVLRRGA